MTASMGTNTVENDFTKPLFSSFGSENAAVSSMSVSVGPAVVEQATLGVTRHRRRSRPSASPERPGAGGGGGGGSGSGSAGGSPSGSGRLPRLRRQSTTLDEGTLSLLTTPTIRNIFGAQFEMSSKTFGLVALVCGQELQLVSALSVGALKPTGEKRRRGTGKMSTLALVDLDYKLAL